MRDFWRKSSANRRTLAGYRCYPAAVSPIVREVRYVTSDLKGRPLEGQVVVVTGAGRGIGRAIVIAVSNAGGRVAALARSQSELNETVALVERAQGSARAFVVDVTDAGAVQAAMKEIDLSLGPVDVLVNNAGQLGRIGPFAESDPVEWWQVLNTNLRGPMLCTRAVLPGMIARRRGRVVNIASGAVSLPYLSPYVTSKTALVRFTETVAAETRAHGIRMFAMAPGTTRTAMSEHSLNSAEGRQWIPWFARIFAEKLDVPIERPARLVVELASGRADALSGRFLTVFDDLNALLGNVNQIEREHLYSLQTRKLDAGNAPAALGDILREGEEGR
jgi:NAD(P)-dependent dehydrogenase (short-subunit alcohol dehydrogenase family)